MHNYKQKKPQTLPHYRTIISFKTKKNTNAKPGFSPIFFFFLLIFFFFFEGPTNRSPKIFDYQKDSPDFHSKGMFADIFMIRGKKSCTHWEKHAVSDAFVHAWVI